MSFPRPSKNREGTDGSAKTACSLRAPGAGQDLESHSHRDSKETDRPRSGMLATERHFVPHAACSFNVLPATRRSTKMSFLRPPKNSKKTNGSAKTACSLRAPGAGQNLESHSQQDSKEPDLTTATSTSPQSRFERLCKVVPKISWECPEDASSRSHLH